MPDIYGLDEGDYGSKGPWKLT